MSSMIQMPGRREMLFAVGFTACFIMLTSVFVGLRPEHLLMAFIFLILFFAGVPARRLAVALLPFFLFGISYDWMRVYPNYEVNPIDVQGIYEQEKAWFGVLHEGNRIIPSEYFALHTSSLSDFMAGLFYLCWVPVPIGYGIWLYLKGERRLYLRFAMVFLLVNLIGFAGYYIHPAAPPWYVINYGFEAVLNTPGNAAGLAWFDALTGLPVFASIYGRNANVFAAVPSLHAAYMIIPLYYAIINKSSKILIAVFAIILVGIWWTAVYTSHHYVIDVLLGIFCALVGIIAFEMGLMRLGWFRGFFNSYYGYIKTT